MNLISSSSPAGAFDLSSYKSKQACLRKVYALTVAGLKFSSKLIVPKSSPVHLLSPVLSISPNPH
jgi:hypothetical protein